MCKQEGRNILENDPQLQRNKYSCILFVTFIYASFFPILYYATYSQILTSFSFYSLCVYCSIHTLPTGTILWFPHLQSLSLLSPCIGWLLCCRTKYLTLLMEAGRNLIWVMASEDSVCDQLILRQKHHGISIWWNKIAWLMAIKSKSWRIVGERKDPGKRYRSLGTGSMIHPDKSVLYQ